MPGKQSSFTWKTETLFKNTKVFKPQFERALVSLTEFYGTKIESEAKKNAPWTDRTGNARNGLTTAVEHEPFKRHTIILFHRVPYGIWLEVKNAGAYAIIMPTLNKQGQAMMNTLNTLLGDLK